MYLFVCLNHFYCENNKGSIFFFCFFFSRCNENEVIVVVAINRQNLHIHVVRLIRKKIYMMDNDLYRPMFA